MPSRSPSRPPILAAALVAVGLLLATSPARAAWGIFDSNPVIFVHGGFGSGGQFESQAMRFTSNGYPDTHLAVLEYDSLFGEQTREDVLAALDDLIAELQASTGSEKVDLMGHSLGTSISQDFLSTPARAANIGHYVNIDGAQAEAPPGGVPTLAIWAGAGTPGRRILGAVNVTLPEQTHVESATSREAFVEMYRFLTEREAAYADIVPVSGAIELEGRAVRFPQNVGVVGATLAIYEVYPFSGRRRTETPLATYEIPADGSWGPFTALAGRRYEFTITRPGIDREHRLYHEPFYRGDRFVRLLTDEPGGALDSLIERSENHTAVTIVRYKELWGDQGPEDDVLRVNGVDVLNNHTSPQSARTIGLFVFDNNSDGITDLSAPIPELDGLPFLGGVDVHIPAETPTRGTVTIKLTPRGVASQTREIRFPAFASIRTAVSVHLHDYETPPSRPSAGRIVGLR